MYLTDTRILFVTYMVLKLAINGFGRIGRLSLRIALKRPDIQVVAINDPSKTAEYAGYLFKYDSVHGTYQGDVIANGDDLIIDGKTIKMFHGKAPKEIPWSTLLIDQEDKLIVIESTGIFNTKNIAQEHIVSGAHIVIVSGPSTDIPMFVMGVNEHMYAGEQIVSNASCTTNCLAPLIKIIDQEYGIVKGLMSTIHSTTASQKTVDGSSNKDWRGGRATATNIIPSSTGASKAVVQVYPEVAGKLTGVSYRIPTIDVSLIDLNVMTKKNTTYQEICQTVKEASYNKYRGVVSYVEEDLVSTDFIGDPHSCIFDAKAGLALDNNFFKLVAWYDNEWGYSNRIVDMAQYIFEQINR